jgi:hypothetical protein
MRFNLNLTTTLVITLVSLHVFAAEIGKSEKGFLLKTSLAYTQNKATTKSESTFILDENNKSWATLVPEKDGLTVLGRMLAHDAKSISMEYLVLDLKRPQSVIAAQKIVNVFDSQAMVESGLETGEKIALAMTATPTDYKKIK